MKWCIFIRKSEFFLSMIIRGNSWGNGKAHKFKKIHEIWKDFRSTEKNGKGRGMITLFNYPNWWTKLFLWNSSKFMLPGINTNFQGDIYDVNHAKKLFEKKSNWTDPNVFKRSNMHFEWLSEFFEVKNFLSPTFFETIFEIEENPNKVGSEFIETITYTRGYRMNEGTVR